MPTVVLVWHGTTQYGAIRDLGTFQSVRELTLAELERRPWLRVCLNLSAVDLEWIDEHAPSFLHNLKRLHAAGRIAVWTSGYSHNFPFFSAHSWTANLEAGLAVHRDLVGRDPDGFYPVELFFHKGLARVLPCHGITVTLCSPSSSLRAPLDSPHIGAPLRTPSGLFVLPSHGRPTTLSTAQLRSLQGDAVVAFSNDWESRFCSLRFDESDTGTICMASPDRPSILQYFSVLDTIADSGWEFALPDALADHPSVGVSEAAFRDSRGVNGDDLLRITGVTSFQYSPGPFQPPVTHAGHRPVSQRAYHTLPHRCLTAESLYLAKLAFDGVTYLESDPSDPLTRRALAAACSDWQTGADTCTHSRQVEAITKDVRGLLREAGAAGKRLGSTPLLKFVDRDSNRNPSSDAIHGASPLHVGLAGSANCQDSASLEVGDVVFRLSPLMGRVRLDAFVPATTRTTTDRTQQCSRHVIPSGSSSLVVSRTLVRLANNHWKCRATINAGIRLSHLTITLVEFNETVKGLTYPSPIDGVLETLESRDGHRFVPYGTGALALNLSRGFLLVAVDPTGSCPSWSWSGRSLDAVFLVDTEGQLHRPITLEWHLVSLGHTDNPDAVTEMLQGLPIRVPDDESSV